MARAPYGPHTVTRILVVMGMVVGYTNRTAPCTRYAAYEGARRLVLVSALGDAIGVSDPSADFRAMRAYRRLRSPVVPVPPPFPPGGWALPTVIRIPRLVAGPCPARSGS
jgi:hypothetical protein